MTTDKKCKRRHKKPVKTHPWRQYKAITNKPMHEKIMSGYNREMFCIGCL